jgi:hypothetical protein
LIPRPISVERLAEYRDLLSEAPPRLEGCNLPAIMQRY